MSHSTFRTTMTWRNWNLCRGYQAGRSQKRRALLVSHKNLRHCTKWCSIRGGGRGSWNRLQGTRMYLAKTNGFVTLLATHWKQRSLRGEGKLKPPLRNANVIGQDEWFCNPAGDALEATVVEGTKNSHLFGNPDLLVQKVPLGKWNESNRLFLAGVLTFALLNPSSGSLQILHSLRERKFHVIAFLSGSWSETLQEVRAFIQTRRNRADEAEGILLQAVRQAAERTHTLPRPHEQQKPQGECGILRRSRRRKQLIPARWHTSFSRSSSFWVCFQVLAHNTFLTIFNNSERHSRQENLVLILISFLLMQFVWAFILNLRQVHTGRDSVQLSVGTLAGGFVSILRTSSWGS